MWTSWPNWGCWPRKSSTSCSWARDCALDTVRGSCVHDRYKNFSDLSEHEHQCLEIGSANCGYEIKASGRLQSSDCLIMAIHGGYIELFTNNLAEDFGRECSVYEFDGVKSSGNHELHICSTHFDEPQLMEMIQGSSSCVSLHGIGAYAGRLVSHSLPS